MDVSLKLGVDVWARSTDLGVLNVYVACNHMGRQALSGISRVPTMVWVHRHGAGRCRPEKSLCKRVQGNPNAQGLSKREVWSTGMAAEVRGEQGKETLGTWVWGGGLEVRLQ